MALASMVPPGIMDISGTISRTAGGLGGVVPGGSVQNLANVVGHSIMAVSFTSTVPSSARESASRSARELCELVGAGIGEVASAGIGELVGAGVGELVDEGAGRLVEGVRPAPRYVL